MRLTAVHVEVALIHFFLFTWWLFNTALTFSHLQGSKRLPIYTASRHGLT